MGSERRRNGRLSLTNFLVGILLLCLVSSLLIGYLYRAVTSSGHYQFSALESTLRESLASLHRNNQTQLGTDRGSNDQVQAASGRLAGLNCDAHGGPSEEIAKEMVYWEDIPSDSRFVSPFKKDGTTQYLTFEPDIAGWNNIRMALETVVALAVAMGRTLVLPPAKQFLILDDDSERARDVFSFSHFFPFDLVGMEHLGLKIITTQEFLEREALAGNLIGPNGIPSFPPNNRTNWDGESNLTVFTTWLRNVTHVTIWDPDECLAAFPATTDPSDIQSLKDTKSSIERDGGFPSYETYIGKPNPVDAPTVERMKEIWASKNELCIYDEKMQGARVVHFPYDDDIPGARLLVHFYAFLFFQDWKQDLWMKRFIRDHIRYVDKIQCAAARIVDAIRARTRARGDPKGNFDSFHIRRGDFGVLANETQIGADEIYKISKDELTENATIYIATNEKKRSFFKIFREHYDIIFLKDFVDQLGDLNPNFHGIVDQLVASRGKVFFGCYFSTFTNYINRLRGYHTNQEKSPGFEEGVIASWYYAPDDRRNEMRTYHPVRLQFFEREFPSSWRLIDTGVNAI